MILNRDTKATVLRSNRNVPCHIQKPSVSKQTLSKVVSVNPRKFAVELNRM